LIIREALAVALACPRVSEPLPQEMRGNIDGMTTAQCSKAQCSIDVLPGVQIIASDIAKGAHAHIPVLNSVG
jgi:hypothetical protein